jgi:hypothetical protein
MPKVFISYAREDKNSATEIYEKLANTGNIEPWLDTKKIESGREWQREIRMAISESDFFIALFSKNYVSKIGFSQTEFKEAWEMQKKFPSDQIYIIPVRLDESDPPSDLKDLQYVNFYENREKGMSDIIEAIETRMPTKKSKTRNEEDISFSNSRYVYRVGITDFDAGLMNLRKLANHLNDIQDYFRFECPTLPSPQEAVECINGKRRLNVEKLPESFHEEEPYITVDFVICLTKYPITFLKNGYPVSNFFTNEPKKDDRFIFISTFQINEFTGQVKCTFEKGITFLMISQLVAYFTELPYHNITLGCPMDKCIEKKDIIQGLKLGKFCPECKKEIKDDKFMDALSKIVSDEMKLK